MRWSSVKTVAAFAMLCGMVIMPAFYDEIAQAFGATVEAAVAKKPVQGCNHPGHVWPDPSQTQELLKRVANGDGIARGQLLERHRAPLRRAIHLHLDPTLGKRLDASDVAQDVLFEASRRLPDYLKNPSLPFHLWLRQIAGDRIIDAHRRHRVAERRALDREQPIEMAAFFDRSSIEMAADPRDRDLTPAAAAVRHALTRRFHAVLHQMDEDDRELIMMRYFEQLSNSIDGNRD